MTKNVTKFWFLVFINTRLNNLANLFSVHNIISLLCHEQVQVLNKAKFQELLLSSSRTFIHESCF